MESIYISNQGNVNFTGKIQYANEIRLNSISRNRTGLGGNTYEIQGNGFSNDLSVAVRLGNHVVRDVTVLSRSTQSITFRTPAHGKNNEVYQVNLKTPAGVFHTCNDCRFTTLSSLSPLVLNLSSFSFTNSKTISFSITGRSFDLGSVVSVELHSCVNRHTQNEKYLIFFPQNFI